MDAPMTIQGNFLLIHRCSYLYRDGELDEEAYKEMGDGDIVARIQPDAWKDIRDVHKILQYYFPGTQT